MAAARSARPKPGSPEETPEDRDRRIAAIRAGVARRRAEVAAATAAGVPPPRPKRSTLGSVSRRAAAPLEMDRAPVDDRDRLEIRRELERGTDPRKVAEEFGAPVAVVNAIRFAMEPA